MKYRHKRYFVYVLAALTLFFLPFFHINGNRLFLLSFEHKKLDIFFVSFSLQELYVMPFLVIILFIGIFFATSLLGRVWCGWACPQTVFRVLYRDFFLTTLFHLRRSIENKQTKTNLEGVSAKFKFGISSLIIAFLCFVASANLMFFFTPPQEFFEHILHPSEHPILMIFWLGFGAFFAFDILVIGENFCIYMCPYARVQSVLYDNDTIMSVYNQRRGGVVWQGDSKQRVSEKDECTECEKCVRICPTHIDIRKGMQLECINCLECVDACVSVMGKLGKPTLVSWSSPNAVESNGAVKWLRGKTFGYIAILALCAALAVIIGGKKESMLLNINRTSELFVERTSGVENHYTMLFHNTSNAHHTLYFEVLDAATRAPIEWLSIITPKKEFSVKAGSKVKQIVTLRADSARIESVLSALGDSHEKTHKFDIIIRAFAVDDETTSVERKSIFVHPLKH